MAYDAAGLNAAIAGFEQAAMALALAEVAPPASSLNAYREQTAQLVDAVLLSAIGLAMAVHDALTDLDARTSAIEGRGA